MLKVNSLVGFGGSSSGGLAYGSVVGTDFNTSASAPDVTWPTVASGDLALLLLSELSGNAMSMVSGFTSITGTSAVFNLGYKVCDGTETGTINVTDTDVDGTWVIVLRFSSPIASVVVHAVDSDGLIGGFDPVSVNMSGAGAADGYLVFGTWKADNGNATNMTTESYDFTLDYGSLLRDNGPVGIPADITMSAGWQTFANNPGSTFTVDLDDATEGDNEGHAIFALELTV